MNALTSRTPSMHPDHAEKSGTTTMGPSDAQTTIRVAELVCKTKLNQIPRDAINYSKSLALSALAGMVSGAQIPSCRIVTRYVQRMGGNPKS